MLTSIVCHRTFFFGDAVALLRESYTFVYRRFFSLYLSDRAYVARCIGLFLILFVLAPHDLNVKLFTRNSVDCFACCICHW